MLDEFFQPPPANATILKIDTDGHEMDVLRGAENLLAQSALNFVEIECQMHGPFDTDASIFSNIDPLLRSAGFSLVKMIPYHYSKRALPSPFSYRFAAQTKAGALMWCDALYVKDPLCLNASSSIQNEILMQYALVYDAYDLHDCAAEILIEFGDHLDCDTTLVTSALDLLTRKATRTDRTYADHIAQFLRDPFSL